MKNISLISFITLVVILYSCKTITVPDDSISMEIPDDIELITIPAGQYRFGENATTATIDYDYKIMKYPVTNKQYVNFLLDELNSGRIIINEDSIVGFYKGDEKWPAGYYLFIDLSDPDSRIIFFPPDIIAILQAYLGPNLPSESYENHPITEVTWFGANAFAKHYGLSLPSVEEWEKAARANTSNIFSWGNSISDQNANYYNSNDKYDNNTTPVGYYNGYNNTIDSPSPYGLYDMSGNVWEWTRNWKNNSPGKIIKGGSWTSRIDSIRLRDNDLNELAIWFEHPVYGYSPKISSNDIGFRCIKYDE